MPKMPVRFKRVAAALFDDVARFESSGSEHSPAESCSGDLLPDDDHDLVNFFLVSERAEDVDVDAQEKDGDGDGDEDEEGEEIIGRRERDKKGTRTRDRECDEDVLQSLVAAFYDNDDPAKSNIHAALEEALKDVGNCSTVDYKRRLMAQLRHRGFDAGLCKAKWEKTNHSLPGYHECIDVMLEGSTRYIVELSFTKEFEIARPTDFYTELLQSFPAIYVGKRDEMKKIVRVMCESMKKSMKSNGMKVPPWRRLGYMNAKWFNSYKRTTNELSTATQKASSNSCFEYDEGFTERNRSVGFVTSSVPPVSQFCRERIFTVKGVRKVGNLAAALQNDSFTIIKA